MSTPPESTDTAKMAVSEPKTRSKEYFLRYTDSKLAVFDQDQTEITDPQENVRALNTIFGTSDITAAMMIARTIERLARQSSGEMDRDRLNELIAVVRGLEPEGMSQAILASQIVAVHDALMEHLWRTRAAETLAQMEYAVKASNKLARTSVAQLELYRKLKGGTEQKITIRHLHVDDGSQAIIGNIHKGGGGKT